MGLTRSNKPPLGASIDREADPIPLGRALGPDHIVASQDQKRCRPVTPGTWSSSSRHGGSSISPKLIDAVGGHDRRTARPPEGTLDHGKRRLRLGGEGDRPGHIRRLPSCELSRPGLAMTRHRGTPTSETKQLSAANPQNSHLGAPILGGRCRHALARASFLR